MSPERFVSKQPKDNMSETIEVKLTGIRPLLMHNGLLADPTNEFTIRAKKITAKSQKKRTLADWEELNRIQWEGSLYWDAQEGPVIPADNIERCVQLGAQKSRLGKDVKAAAWCAEPEFRLEYDGPRDKEKMFRDSRFVHRVCVVVDYARIIRIRPMIPTGWSLRFSMEYDETILNGKDLIKAIEDAGKYIGLGDWRPKFGRFVVEVLS